MNLAKRAGVLIALLATIIAAAPPALADQLSISCSVKGHNFNGWAYYTDAGSAHQWTSFQYELGGATTGGSSNVRLWVHDGPDVPYWNHSPDTLDNGQIYTVTPPWAVYTAMASLEWVLFQAVFDISGPDPNCGAHTYNI